LLEEQLRRIDAIKEASGAVDFTTLPVVKIGVIGGDGIGPAITRATKKVLERILAREINSGTVVLSDIEGLTLENRLRQNKPIPDETLEAIRDCDVILKGPTETPQAGGGVANIESANVAMRKALDLFANVRPVRVPDLGIDWTFFRENTEGAYVLGSKGIGVGSELCTDFTVATKPGCERIINAAFEFASQNGKKRVSAVTKANVIKKTDGMFLEIFKEISKGYPGIETDEWYVDIMAAKLIDDKRRRSFEVLVMPNLYGDILSDEAAEFMGGVGSAGSANIGARHAMFEAIHGSAPRMVAEGREAYANPSSLMRAAAMLLSHIGRHDKAARLGAALDKRMFSDKKIEITGRPDGATCDEFTDGVLVEIDEA